MNITMGRHTFAFSNVLPVDKVDDFYVQLKHLFEDLKFIDMIGYGQCVDSLRYMDCMVEGLDTEVQLQELTDGSYPKLRNLKGTIQFASKHKLTDVKRLFLSGLGKTLCRHLFIVPVPNVYKYRRFANEDVRGNHRCDWWGKFKKPKKIKNKGGL